MDAMIALAYTVLLYALSGTYVISMIDRATSAEQYFNDLQMTLSWCTMQWRVAKLSKIQTTAISYDPNSVTEYITAET